jgi:malate synthase
MDRFSQKTLSSSWAQLHHTFDSRRRDLLAQPVKRQEAIDAGKMPDFLPETEAIRTGSWTVAPIPPDIMDRRVEITGPFDRK